MHLVQIIFACAACAYCWRLFVTVRLIRWQLTTLFALLGRLANRTEVEVMTLAELKAKVESETTVINSAVTLIAGLAQQLKDALAAGDPAAIQAIADQLDAEVQPLAAAVAANTPA